MITNFKNVLKNTSKLNMAGQAGFSLIEMIVVVAILGIILAIATPSFKSAIDAERMNTAVQKFISDTDFARSEALKRGQVVFVCATTDTTTCSNNLTTANSTWTSGWMVFASNGAAFTASPAATDRLRLSPALSHGDTFTGGAVVQMSGNGYNNQPGVTVSMHNGANDVRRCVTLTAGSAGKIAVTASCP